MLTCFKEISRKSALVEYLGCHLVHLLVFHIGTWGPRKGIPGAQLGTSSKC